MPTTTPVDLRSDTVTRPSAAMRAAMSQAEVGDDLLGEDPTVRALEERVADLFGHQAAVFVPSGTMGNQICLRLLVPGAGELVCDADAHVVTYEGGAAAQHGGIQTRTVPGGELDVAAVLAQVRPEGFGTVVTSAVSVEQTHNRAGGLVHPLERLQELRAATRVLGVALHCDGARIWNAHVASGVPLATYGGVFDSLSVCLSKGLGAPVGSLVVTSHELAEQARVLRRRLGGGWRQAGLLAAAGLHALDHHLERLAEDHARAALLARLLGLPAPQTNLVLVDVGDAPRVAAAAATRGVLVGVVGPSRLRLVTHLDVDDRDVRTAADVLGPVLAGEG